MGDLSFGCVLNRLASKEKERKREYVGKECSAYDFLLRWLERGDASSR